MFSAEGGPPSERPLQTYTITPERAAQLKAEAIAARRASRAPWQNAHADRLGREREARRISKEYRQAQREAAPAEKRCSACGELLPLESFSPAHRDRPTARCKPCVAAATRARYHSDLEKARARTRARNRIRNRPVDPDRECKAAERRQKANERLQRLSEDRQRKADERRRKAAERVAQLSALLAGTNGGPRISTEEQWDLTMSELRQLWLQSGDKECVSCKAVVPPAAMLPPGPANFYPGRCRSCAREESLANHLRVTGRPFEGEPLIPLLDGTSITIGELARRHREREQAYRTKRG